MTNVEGRITAPKDVDVWNMVPLDSLRSLGTPLDR